MYETRKKNYVFMELKRNEYGFTFVSQLLTLTILIISLPLIVFLLNELNIAPEKEHISAHQFFIFLYHDTMAAHSVTIDEDALIFKVEDDIAKIEQYHDMVRRTVSGQGHEVYIRDIDTFRLKELDYGYQVTIKMLNGEEYEKKIAFNE